MRDEVVSASLSVDMSMSFREVFAAFSSKEAATSLANSRFFERSSLFVHPQGCADKKSITSRRNSDLCVSSNGVFIDFSFLSKELMLMAPLESDLFVILPLLEYAVF